MVAPANHNLVCGLNGVRRFGGTAVEENNTRVAKLLSYGATRAQASHNSRNKSNRTEKSFGATFGLRYQSQNLSFSFFFLLDLSLVAAAGGTIFKRGSTEGR